MSRSCGRAGNGGIAGLMGPAASRQPVHLDNPGLSMPFAPGFLGRRVGIAPPAARPGKLIFLGDRCISTGPITAAQLRAGRCRQAGAPLRLGASQARSRQSAVHRSARPLRRHPMRDRYLEPAVQGGRGRSASKSVVTITGKVVQRPPETMNTKLATGEIEVQIEEFTVQSAAEVLPLQVASDEDCRRGHPPALPLPRSAAREGPPQHRAALPGDLQHPPAHDRAGLHRVPDADPDLELARGRARLPGAEPPASRQVLCACPRRRSSSSSC